MQRGADSRPVIDLTGMVYFGTADAAKNLGTGENDYAAQLDVAHEIPRPGRDESRGHGGPRIVRINRVAGDLLTRSRQAVVLVTVPPGALKPGHYRVTLVAERGSRA